MREPRLEKLRSPTVRHATVVLAQEKHSLDTYIWPQTSAPSQGGSGLGVPGTVAPVYKLSLPQPAFGSAGGTGGSATVVTPMPGKVVKVMKKEGDQVIKGETVLILEAMKMENEIKSGADGVIKSVNIKEGQALEAGFLMIEIEEDK